MQTVSSRDTVRKEVPRDGHIGFRSDYIGSPGIIDAVSYTHLTLPTIYSV